MNPRSTTSLRSTRPKRKRRGAKLNEAALEAVRQWRYEPALDEAGHPTEIEMTLTINFKLASEASPKGSAAD